MSLISLIYAVLWSGSAVAVNTRLGSGKGKQTGLPNSLCLRLCLSICLSLSLSLLILALINLRSQRGKTNTTINIRQIQWTAKWTTLIIDEEKNMRTSSNDFQVACCSYADVIMIIACCKFQGPREKALSTNNDVIHQCLIRDVNQTFLGAVQP